MSELISSIAKSPPPDLEKGEIVHKRKTSAVGDTADDELQPETISDRRLEGDPEAPFAQHCRPDAHIWGLYLNETEVEDKEITDLWKDSLDSLLVFAGLFAAILTALLVESRKDLKEDPQEVLLRQLVNILSNQPNSPKPFQPDLTSIHVNLLWFTSLTLTLIAALGGVLAKGWLAKYNPASNRERSSDACERHLRAIRARQWRLEPFISGIPLLIQISLFIFFIGLILQVIHGDIRIWAVVVVLVGSTVLMYIVGTCLPWFSPSCPFQTPISNFFIKEPLRTQNKDGWTNFDGSNGSSLSRARKLPISPETISRFVEEVRRRPDQLVLQAQILSWIITNSTKEGTIEEAIRAVAGSKSTKDLQDTLIQAGVREYLYQKLQYSVTMTPGLAKIIHNESFLESLLYALLRIEQPLAVDEGPTDDIAHTSILDDGQPLHRCDDFKPYLRALAFSLRVHILVNRDLDDHEENWTQTVANLDLIVEGGTTPYIRNVLFLAAIRGFLRGRKILRRACAFVLSKQAAIAELREKLYSIGCYSEGSVGHSNGIENSSTHEELLSRLAELCGDEDRLCREACVRTFLKLAGYAKLHRGIIMAIPKFVDLLSNQNDINIRTATIVIFRRLAKYEELYGALRDCIPHLIKLLEDDDYNIRLSTRTTLVNLASHTDLRDAIRDAIPHLIARLKDKEGYIKSTTPSTFVALAEHAELREALKDTIIPLIEQNRDETFGVRSSVIPALTKLATHELHEAIKSSIPQLMNQLKDINAGIRSAAISTLVCLARQVQFFGTVQDAIPEFVKRLNSPNSQVQSAIVTAFKDLAPYMEFREGVRTAIPVLIQLLTNLDSVTRSVGATALGSFADYVELHDDIKKAITTLFEQCKYTIPSVRSAATSALVNMGNHPELRDSIQSSIPNFVEETNNSVSSRSITFTSLADLAKQKEFRDSIRPFIPQLIDQLKDRDSTVRSSAALALSNLADYMEFHEGIRNAVPTLIELLRERSPSWLTTTPITGNASSVAATTLSKLSKHADLRDPIKAASAQLIGQIKDEKPGVRSAIVSILIDLDSSSQDEFGETVRATIPQLIEQLKDQNTFIRQTTVSLLVNLAEQVEFRENIRAAIVSLVEIMRDKNPTTTTAVVAVISKLAKHVDLHNSLQIAIPLLIERFKEGKSDTAPILADLAEHAVFFDSIRPAIPELVRLLEQENADIQAATKTFLLKLIDRAEFLDTFEVAIPTLVPLLENKSPSVRSIASTIIFSLSQYPKLCTSIGSSMLLTASSTVLSSPNEILNSSLIQESNTDAHQLMPLSYAPQYLAGSPHLDPNRPVVAQLWRRLSSKESNKLQNGLQTLSQLAKIFREFTQPVEKTINKVIKRGPRSVITQLSVLAEHAKLTGVMDALIPCLCDLLEASEPSSRKFAVSMLAKFAQTGGCSNTIDSSLGQVIAKFKTDGPPPNWTVNKEQVKTRLIIASELLELAKHAKLRGPILPAVLTLVTLLRINTNDIKSSVAATLDGLAAYVEFRDPIVNALPSLVSLLKDTNARPIVVLTLDRFAVQIGAVIPSLVKLLGDSNPTVRSAAALTFAELAAHPKHRVPICTAVEPLFDLLRDKDTSIRSTAASTLATLSRYAELHAAISGSILKLVELLNDTSDNLPPRAPMLSPPAPYRPGQPVSSPSSVGSPSSNPSPQGGYNEFRAAAASTLGELCIHDGVRGSLSVTISPLFTLIKDKRRNVRFIATSTISKLVVHADLHDSIRNAIPSLVELLKDTSIYTPVPSYPYRTPASPSYPQGRPVPTPTSVPDVYSEIRSTAAETLGILVAHSELRDPICGAIIPLISLLKDRGQAVRNVATSTMGKLAGHVEFHELIRKSIPSIIDLLNYTPSGQPTPAPYPQPLSKPSTESLSHIEVRSTAAATLGELSAQENLRGSISLAVRPLVDLLKDPDAKLRSNIIVILGQLGSHVDIYESLRTIELPLVKLLKDPGVRIDATKAIDKLVTHTELHDSVCIAVPQLIELLKSPDRVNVSATLVKLASYAKLHDSIRNTIPRLIDLLKEQEGNVRSIASSTLVKLGEQIELQESLRKSIPKLKELLEDQDETVRAITVSTFGKLAVHVDLQDTIVEVVPIVVKLLKDVRENIQTIPVALGHNGLSDVRSSAAGAVGELTLHDQLRPLLLTAVPPLIDLLQDDNNGTRLLSSSIIKKLASHAEFHAPIREAVPTMINQLKHERASMRSAAALTLGRLSECVELRESIQDAVPSLIELLKEEPSGPLPLNIPTGGLRSAAYGDNREIAASSLGELAVHGVLSDSICDAITPLIGLLKNATIRVRTAASDTLCKLSAHAKLHEPLRAAIPGFTKLLKEKRVDLLSSAVFTIEKLATHVELHDSIQSIMPSVIQLLNYVPPVGSMPPPMPLPISAPTSTPAKPSTEPVEYHDIRYAATYALGELAVHPKLRGSICAAIPLLVKILFYGPDAKIRTTAASTLEKISPHAEFHGSIRANVALVFKQLTSTIAVYQSIASSTINKWITHAGTIIFAFDQLIQNQADGDKSVIISAFVDLAERAELTENIRAAIPSLIELLKATDSKLRSTTVQALIRLSSRSEFLEAFEKSIPQILQLFKYHSADTHLAAADLICALAEHRSIQAFITQPPLNIIQMLKNKSPTTRTAAAKVIQVLVKYPNMQYVILQSRLPPMMVEFLHDRNVGVLEPLTHIFCALVNQGHIHKEILQAVIFALNALEDSDSSIQACGATVLSVMSAYASCRNILFNVCKIHASIQLFMEDATPQDAGLILQRMEYFGVLHEP